LRLDLVNIGKDLHAGMINGFCGVSNPAPDLGSRPERPPGWL
jgi:hypothetical protein